MRNKELFQLGVRSEEFYTGVRADPPSAVHSVIYYLLSFQRALFPESSVLHF